MSPLVRRAVSSFSCSTVAEEALRTWGSVYEGEKGPADPADAFKSGARVSGNTSAHRRGLPPCRSAGEGGRVAKSCRLFFDRKKGRAAAVTRKRGVELHPRYRSFGVGLPAPQTDRHRTAARWKSRTPSLKGATCRHSSLTTARRVAGEGGAWCAGSRAEAERSGARGAGSRRLNNASAKGGGARSAGSRPRRRGA